MRGAAGLRVGLLFAACGVAACAAARPKSVQYTAPPSDAYEPRPRAFRAWQGQTIRVTVVDAREERVESDALVSATRDAIVRGLARGRIAVGTPGQASIEVEILHYRADHVARDAGKSYWRGCVRCSGVASTATGQRREIPIERCVNRPAMWGPPDGDEALQQAFAEAVDDLLAAADDLRP